MQYNGATFEVTEGQRDDEMLVTMVAGGQLLQAYIDATDAKFLIAVLEDALAFMRAKQGGACACAWGEE